MKKGQTYKRIPKISLQERHLPYKWQEKLVKNQEIGGVFLVFLSGKNNVELDAKVKLLQGLCKNIAEFATLTPVTDREQINGVDPKKRGE